MKEMNEILLRLLWGQLQSLGAFAGPSFKLAELKTSSGIQPLYERWLEASIALLTRHHYLTCEQGIYTVNDPTLQDRETIWQEWEANKGLWLEDPRTQGQVALVEITLRAMPEILTGKIPATAVMFPNASLQLVEGVYKNNPVADYFNEILAETVAIYIEERLSQEPTARIRIIEIGAGTGGTSTVVFKKLQPYREQILEYCYTDLSQAFLFHAETEYGPDYPYLTYRIFDVAAPLSGQAIAMGEYDLAIATNVLHATRNIRQTLRNAKSTLKRNGLLLLNEISNQALFTHLTFGLLEGWWLYEDAELRIPGCPGLAPQTWRMVLEDEGFQSVLFPAQEAHDLGQQIIVAESDGLIRQKQQAKRSEAPPEKHLPKRSQLPQAPRKSRKQSAPQNANPTRGGVPDQRIADFVRTVIKEAIGEALRMEEERIQDDRSFSDYGVDSIVAVNLVNLINKRCRIALPTTVLFDYNNVDQLSKQLLQNQHATLVALLQEQEPVGETPTESFDEADNEAQTAARNLTASQGQWPKTPFVQPGPNPVTPEKVLDLETDPNSALFSKEPIAIIGMSGRFAGSQNVNELWEHLAHGDDLIQEASRWDLDSYYPPGSSYCRTGGFLDAIDQFDPLFFNISGLEATFMDPQQRLFLEEAWKALEDGGYAGEAIQGRQCGVYVGCAGGDYLQLLGSNPPPQAFWGNAGSVIPARIAYYLDLQGPAIAVDTACSSSLVAVHLACQGLWAGETELALAGGVFLQSTPGFYLASNRAGMLSPTGRCYTFDARADGFVPGEGVGVVLLKRLNEAIADGDQIYGVIRGSGINQDGTTNGITAPSANSQERLERYVYDTFQIDPAQIQLVEAHGTGTKLGDPIEYQALTRSFRAYTDKQAFCAIGSIKSNLGHTSAAAGITGLIKVLLALGHQQIPPSIHFRSGNPHIQFDDSPFYVNTTLKNWEIEPEATRCAVTSSFGFSGTNAHLVVGEAPPLAREHSEQPGYLIVLSARTAQQCKQQAEQLLDFCEREPAVDLGNMSYTLLLGRKHFSNRWACVVRSRQELLTFLKKWLAKGKLSQIYTSEFHASDQREQPSLKRYGNECIQNCHNAASANDYLDYLAAVADLYVQGYALDFDQLFRSEPYVKISLPTYPFARERYWIHEAKPALPLHSTEAATLHPLVHQNTSDLTETRFSSRFTGEEIFFADDRVLGQPRLPEMAYLEMARAAVQQAMGMTVEIQAGIRLRNVAWFQSLIAGAEGVKVHTALFPEADDAVAFEIYSDAEGLDGESVVYSQGIVALENHDQAQTAPVLELSAVQAECRQAYLAAGQCDEFGQSRGNDYGPAFQTIEQLYLGTKQALAKIVLPSAVAATLDRFGLHPGLLEAALQTAAIGLENVASRKPLMAQTLDALEIFAKCPAALWALVHFKDDGSNGIIPKCDIDLCNAQGQVCVRLQGLQMQERTTNLPVTANEAPKPILPATASSEPFELMTFEEIWQEEPLPKPGSTPGKTVVCFLSDPVKRRMLLDLLPALDPQANIVLIAQGAGEHQTEPNRYTIAIEDPATIQAVFQSIRAAYETVDALLYLWPLEDERYLRDISPLVPILQALNTSKLNPGRILLSGQAKNGLERCYLDSWIGLERSLGMILPHTPVAVVYQSSEGPDSEMGLPDWIRLLWAELHSNQPQSVWYQAGKRLVSQVRPLELPAAQPSVTAGGTYLITGGCGELGFLLAQHLAKQQSVNLILTGRSALETSRQMQIKALEALGSRVNYFQVDICDAAGMRAALNQVKADWGDINGVIHVAGIESVDSILEKDRFRFNQVMAPKITGTLVLDALLQEEPLDFSCYFSSASAILGDFGACDYAIGNRFMMAYADYRHQAQYPGKSVVINWPLWRDGGMGVKDDATSQMYFKSSGQRFLESEEGLAVFDRILARGNLRNLVLVGQRSRVYRFLKLTESPVAPIKLETPGLLGKGRRAEMKGLSLEACLEWDLKELMSQLLQIPREQFDATANLADFGFDSISLAEFAARLTKHYGIEITPALFFQCPTLVELIHHFSAEHSANLQEFYREALPGQWSAPNDSAPAQLPQRAAQRKSRLIQRHLPQGVPEPIAIIGMSGRFPEARTVDELWSILFNGREVLRELPPDRFGGVGSRWKCGLIPGVSEFDPLFFEISPKEAAALDPKQRLLLQESWRALEDAGYGTAKLKNSKIGMYVGVEESQYGELSQEKGNITANHNGVLAARLAYFLNLSGPNMAINTACSSGLVAAHQACWSLRNRECDTAIAAGVNVLVLADLIEVLHQAGMLSEDNRCYAFDQRANGMVPSEAVAAVVLKRLSQAEADGDRIYAVIKGSAINYDGKTNGITAPSGSSQTELLKAVYEQYQVNPESIDYVVAHGTGTKLGDPIEINALVEAFKGFTRKQAYCALTSTKTNLGHAFAASGLVSLISLVQALRHETIPASLHCEQENPYINWKESPFYVNKANRAWPQAGLSSRLGAVSAFGMSGTNVHMVVESYATATPSPLKPSVPCFLLALSAKTAEALQERIQALLHALGNPAGRDADLSAISYTLLEGRQHFDHRAAVVIKDCADAVYVWQQAGSRERLPNLFRGSVPRDFRGQKAIADYAHDLLKRSWELRANPDRYQEILYTLADLYCQGYDLPWNELYGTIKPRCVSLPAYPFARETYWVQSNGNAAVVSAAAGVGVLHPLLHQNTSDLSEQRFTSSFSGNEFFLADHQVKGQSLLPGVAYLEMARAAVEQATANQKADQSGIRLKNVVWIRPIAVGEHPVNVHIGLFPEANGEIAFEIYREAETADGEPVVHCQGSAVLHPVASIPDVDLPALQAQCGAVTFGAEQSYAAFRAMGFHYGPGHQGIAQLAVGAGQVLAKLSLPSNGSTGWEQFVLQPGMLDSALQASIGFMLERGEATVQPFLPFALQEIAIFGRCTPVMWAWLRSSTGSQLRDKLQKLDLDLCDSQGKVQVQIKGFTSRILENEVGSVGTELDSGTLLLHPYWKEAAVSHELPDANPIEQLVILSEPYQHYQETIAAQLTGGRCLTLKSVGANIGEQFQDYALQVFQAVQSLLAAKPAGPVLVQLIVADQGEQQLAGGLSGILQTGQLENPQLIGQVIATDPATAAEELLAILQENRRDRLAQQIRYQDGKRYVAAWREVETAPEIAKIPWKKQGVYLITGGAGGLGRIFAREIAQKAQGAIIILTGRSPLNQSQQAWLRELGELGVRVEYRLVDVTQAQAVVDLVQEIQAQYGGINGIIHSAGVIRDNFILKKSAAEFRSVLAPKVNGLVNLDQATQELSLDFLLLFSSGAGVFGNAGQADYATANAFMDRYARYRNALVRVDQRHGQTVSINWPLWQAGGMRISAEAESLMRQNTGMAALPTATGIRVLYQSLAAAPGQLLVMAGELQKLRALIFKQTDPPRNQQPNFRNETRAVSLPEPDIFPEKAANCIKTLLAGALNLPAHRIETDAPLEKYGIDSLMVMQLTNQLENSFGSLPKTLFFEYQTIRDLTNYFLANYREPLQQLCGDRVQTAALDGATQAAVTHEAKPLRGRRQRSRFNALPREKPEHSALEIAIIGVAGRYPQADNLREFWINLRDGRDCITEIPEERWDHRLYFDADKNRPGKAYSKWGGFINGVDQFDPLFFNISPREAEIMDPQERLFLECVYATLEDAGYTRETLGANRPFGLGGNVGVYVGVMYEEYQLYGAQEQTQGRPVAASGNPAAIANRVSYFCNFHGPSMAVDTMCSSSLAAIHLACQSIRQGECAVAIAGGVNVSIHPNKYLLLSQGKFASSKGRCESFGAGGDGYVPGEGVGAVLLKPLTQAVADGDQIYGVIKGTAINHGGKTNGYTVPNPNAQAEVIGRALQTAGIDPRTISYIEAHGTGTSLGDPIEIAGLSKTFQAFTAERQFCAIGSAKSNIGHCESAAGIAGVTKVLLQLKYGQLAPSIHAETLNPNIDFAATAFRVQRELAQWERPRLEKDGSFEECPRIAGISAFGAGGSNAHVVIEEYRLPAKTRSNPGKPVIIVLSAKNEARLREQVQQLLAAIGEQQFSEDELEAMAYTLQTGREAMEERLAVRAGSLPDLAAKLQNYLDGQIGGGDLYRGQIKHNQETLDLLAADEDLAQIIDLWIAKGKIGKMLELWVKGLAVDWNCLYGERKPGRISLPTYPFAPERYWAFGEPSRVLQEALPPGGEAYPVERVIRYLQKQWEPCAGEATRPGPQAVVILTTPETRELAQRLTQAFPQSRILLFGELEAFLQQPESDWQQYDGWIDLVGCGLERNENHQWLECLQKLIEHGPRTGLMLLGVTKGLETYHNPVVNLAGASRAGLYRLLQSEYGFLRSRHLDADPAVSDQTLAQQIVAEFLLDSEEVEVCYRDGARYRSYLDERFVDPTPGSRWTFPEDQVVLITGGTRGIGYLCAQHFVTHHGVRRLVLTGREPFPPRAEWPDYQAQPGSLAQKIRAIQALEALGAEVQVLAVPLTDAAALRARLETIKRTMGPIGGVLHCAGSAVAENPAFIRKSLPEMQTIWEPKVAGLDNLVDSLADQPLRFLVLFSSVAAIIPALGSGQSDYAMANAYMDYLATAQRRNCPIVSIQWPSWKETGMGEVKSRAYQQTGLLSHTNQEGLQLLDQVLAGQLGPVVLPAVVNPALWQPRQLLLRQKLGKLPFSGHAMRLNAVGAAEAATTLVAATQSWLSELLARELKLDPAKLEVDRDFQDYGVDSILLAQLLRAINQQLETDLDPSLLFEYATVENLAAWLVSQYAEVLGRRFASRSLNPAKEQTPAATPTAPLFVSVAAPQRILTAETDRARGSQPLDIAVVGLACRFPGADTVEAYWQLLAEGRSAIRPVPQERWGYANPFYAGLLDTISQFDPQFFLIPESDVRAMDPQALAVLEECLKLWYHAGYSHLEIKGKPIGVYLGGRSQHRPSESRVLQAQNPIVTVGQNYLAANLSQFFDLRGPSIVLDTACSSALTGMNMAVQALNSGEIIAAVVGGVSLLTSDASHRIFTQRGILSPEPYFHLFDQRSQGIVLGEGVGMVLLKTVDQALEDGDQIYAVIKGLAINNDGRTAGPATPNIQAHKAVLQAALDRSGKAPESIAYLEANGSGLEVTDLLELKAIEAVYRSSNSAPLGLGSIKPNIGHPLCAEGIASFIKVVLMLHRRQFVPFLSGEQPLTHFDLAASPFYFERQLRTWQQSPRTAALNCFADGGTNAHVILEAWEAPISRGNKRQPTPAPELKRKEFATAGGTETALESRKEALPTSGVTAKVIWEM